MTLAWKSACTHAATSLQGQSRQKANLAHRIMATAVGFEATGKAITRASARHVSGTGSDAPYVTGEPHDKAAATPNQAMELTASRRYDLHL